MLVSNHRGKETGHENCSRHDVHDDADDDDVSRFLVVRSAKIEGALAPWEEADPEADGLFFVAAGGEWRMKMREQRMRGAASRHM